MITCYPQLTFAISRCVLNFLVLLALSMPSVNGQSARSDTSTLGSISGSTLGSARERLREVPVTVIGPAFRHSAKSDAEGKFSTPPLPAGTYQVTAGPRPPFLRTTRRVTVLSGQQLKDVDMSLPLEAIVGGKIIDSDKTPLPGVGISLVAYSFRRGRRELVSTHSTITNDLGEFRFSGLRSGSYYLRAQPKPGEMVIAKTPIEERRPPALQFVSTYFPNSQTQDGAVPIVLRDGSVIDNLSFMLEMADTTCINTAIAVDADVPPFRIIRVRVSEFATMNQSITAYGTAKDGDQLEACGLPAGRYVLWATADVGDGHTAYASQDFELYGRAMRLPQLRLAVGHRVTGRIILAEDPEDRPFPKGIVVTLEQKDRIALRGETTRAEVDTRGTFQLANVFADQYWLAVGGLPKGYYVRSARSGSDDILRVPFRRTGADIEIYLGNDGASIQGRVTNSQAQTVPEAAVIVAKISVTGGPSDFTTATTDQSGQFVLDGVAPGEYAILAILRPEEANGISAELFRPLITRENIVTLAPKQELSKTITLSER